MDLLLWSLLCVFTLNTKTFRIFILFMKHTIKASTCMPFAVLLYLNENVKSDDVLLKRNRIKV